MRNRRCSGQALAEALLGLVLGSIVIVGWTRMLAAVWRDTRMLHRQYAAAHAERIRSGGLKAQNRGTVTLGGIQRDF